MEEEEEEDGEEGEEITSASLKPPPLWTPRVPKGSGAPVTTSTISTSASRIRLAASGKAVAMCWAKCLT